MRGKRRAPRTQVPWRSPWALVICGLAVLVVGGVATVSAMAKDVEIVVDGRQVAVRSFAGSVNELLAEAGVSVGFGDVVRPGGQEDVADGGQIVVRHARLFKLTVDGHTVEHMVTAGNVADALAELHLPAAGGRMSAPPDGAVPPEGMALTMFTERRVYVMAGVVRQWTKTTGSVRDVLRKARVTLRPGDRVRPALDSFPRDGSVIRVIPQLAVLPVRAEAIQAAITRLNWPALAACESHGNPKAVDSAGGYYGMYQFSLPMWRAVGGSGTPNLWPAEEQTYRAQLLYQRVGGRWQGQWPNCGTQLFG